MNRQREESNPFGKHQGKDTLHWLFCEQLPINRPLAQLAEHPAHNRKVSGSFPLGSTGPDEG